jgi:hypothetical protein
MAKEPVTKRDTETNFNIKDDIFFNSSKNVERTLLAEIRSKTIPGWNSYPMLNSN